MMDDRLLGELAGIRQALEGILARLTPAEERDKVVLVGSYVRSANNGGELVWLYGQHPGLQWKVATVYVEDFPALAAFLDPQQGKVYDGEVAPSREAAGKKGYLVECTPFEAVLAPTGRRTDSDMMIYAFKAARAATAAPPTPQDARQGTQAGTGTTQPTQTHKQAGAPQTPATAATDGFDELPSAGAARRQAGEAVVAKLRTMAAGYNGQGSQPASDDQRQRAFNNLRTLCGNSEAKRHAVIQLAFGKASLTELTAGEAQAVRDWVHVTKQGEEWLPSPTAIEDLKALMALTNVGL